MPATWLFWFRVMLPCADGVAKFGVPPLELIPTRLPVVVMTPAVCVILSFE